VAVPEEVRIKGEEELDAVLSPIGGSSRQDKLVVGLYKVLVPLDPDLVGDTEG